MTAETPAGNRMAAWLGELIWRMPGLDQRGREHMQALGNDYIAAIEATATHPPYPLPEDFEAMSDDEFEAYVERIGFGDRIKRALAEPLPPADITGLILDNPTLGPVVKRALAEPLEARIPGWSIGEPWNPDGTQP